MKYLNYSELTQVQIQSYKELVRAAFPELIFKSDVVSTLWDKVERYFPDYQIFMINTESKILGFINTIPIYWKDELSNLPDEGWDWLMRKGIDDYETGIKPNSLGGLQAIVSKESKGQGLSRILLNQGKKLKDLKGFQHFILPIRPTFKSRHPQVKMSDYINYTEDNKVYDPWIRTHLKSGARIVRVCSNSMNIKGDINYWQGLTKKKINESGNYEVEGALNLVYMDLEKNQGEYREDNIWVSYD